jgi:type II secretory pathway component PulJ
MRIDPLIARRRLTWGRRRGAMTLLELMASISVLLIIGISAASILGKVTDIGARSSSSQQYRQSVQRLSGVLRRDVRGATEVNLASDEALIELVADARVIRYLWNSESGDLIRQSKRDDLPTEFDRFKLPPDCRPTVRASGDVVALDLKQQRQQHPWIIEAKRP